MSSAESPKKKGARPPKESGPGCATCRHWVEDHDPGAEVRAGECHRHPPTVMYSTEDGAFTLWPFTSATDLCAEHAQRLQ